MTSRRYSNYLHARSLITAIDDGRIEPRPLAVLREVSEAMLLSREASRDALEDELDQVARELTRLIEAELIGVETGSRLWRVILASGPPGGSRGDEVAAAQAP